MNTNRELKGKIYDPVFICMLIAIVLAVGSSLLLRVMNHGPTAARAANAPVERHSPDDAQPDE